MAVRGGRTSGPEIEIGRQLVVHPEHNTLAETSDHDADRGHHRNGGRKRTDKNGSPAQGRREACREVSRKTKSERLRKRASPTPMLLRAKSRRDSPAMAYLRPRERETLRLLPGRAQEPATNPGLFERGRHIPGGPAPSPRRARPGKPRVPANRRMQPRPQRQSRAREKQMHHSARWLL